jgi:D-glycero-alpha-D-manno-heptose-7-phosphate kinase
MDEAGRRPAIVMARAPLRISFAGGGTDLREYYAGGYGAVLSTTIDKFVYVTVKRHGTLFNERYRLNYSESENVRSLDEIKNAIMREALRAIPVEPPIYVSTVADIPAMSGLGSSSSFAVAMVLALHAIRGERVSTFAAYELAARIEIEILGRPMGKQDHAAAAFGGLNYFRFLADGSTSVEPLAPPSADLRRLFDCLQLFWTDQRRDSSSVLRVQKANTESRRAELDAMRAQAETLRNAMRERIDPQSLGTMLDEGWRLKRGLADGISNDAIDGWYAAARRAGAWGGKIAGAGGGGFLLLVVPPDRRASVAQALSDLVEVPIAFEPEGARIVYTLAG